VTLPQRAIPSTGEPLPILGLGTWQVLDLPPALCAERAPVVRELFRCGGTLLDSSPMYGRSEACAGELLRDLGLRDRAFVATKVWTTGRAEGEAQLQRSLELFGGDRLDLVQVHNIVDLSTQLATLRRWQSHGRVRYVGVTHYAPSAHAQMAAVLRRERLDFVQLDYAADDRSAERELLPLAQQRGIAVLVNRPFGGGALLRRLAARPQPPVARELQCASWAQLLLKFVLAHPAVTCAIPATGDVAHLGENIAAAAGLLPDRAQCEAIAAAVA